MLPNTHALAPSDLLAPNESPASPPGGLGDTCREFTHPNPPAQAQARPAWPRPMDWEGQRFPGGGGHPGT